MEYTVLQETEHLLFTKVEDHEKVAYPEGWRRRPICVWRINRKKGMGLVAKVIFTPPETVQMNVLRGIDGQPAVWLSDVMAEVVDRMSMPML